MLYRLFGAWNVRRIEECTRVIRWLDPRSGERILDVGCGTGENDERIANHGAHVVGIDLNSERISVARRRHATPRSTFVLMDSEHLGFREASFDKVVSFCVIEHFTRDDVVLHNVREALRPGGTLCLSADSLTNEGIREEERRAHSNRYSVNTYYDREIMEQKLHRAGFRIERMRYILTTRLSLALVRASWRLDDLAPAWMPAKVFGYAILGTVGLAASLVSEAFAGRPDRGLTLLVLARRER